MKSLFYHLKIKRHAKTTDSKDEHAIANALTMLVHPLKSGWKWFLSIIHILLVIRKTNLFWNYLPEVKTNSKNCLKLASNSVKLSN